MANDNIMGRAILLLIVLIGIGYLYSYSDSDILNTNEETEIEESQKEKEKVSYIELKKTKEVSNKNVVVSDKYVGKLNVGEAVVVKDKDGSAYIVTKGTVLVEGMLITANEKESSVYKIDEPIKSVSSN
ncbi:MAG: hypothetical protein KC589_01125 [Nanoarchaeota archaeon]|nr:hypothetical protein [Nanoarchaeota archaeon]